MWCDHNAPKTDLRSVIVYFKWMLIIAQLDLQTGKCQYKPYNYSYLLKTSLKACCGSLRPSGKTYTVLCSNRIWIVLHITLLVVFLNKSVTEIQEIVLTWEDRKNKSHHQHSSHHQQSRHGCVYLLQLEICSESYHLCWLISCCFIIPYLQTMQKHSKMFAFCRKMVVALGRHCPDFKEIIHPQIKMKLSICQIE